MVKRQLNLLSNFKNWPQYFVWKHLSGRKNRFTFITRSGLNITVLPRMMHTFKECFFREVYFEQINIDNPAPIVIDVGANTGYFSLFVFHHFPMAKVFSFEPVPQNFRMLQQYKEQFPQLDWHPFNQAVSNKRGSLKLHLESADDITTSASISGLSQHTTTVEVPAVSLPDVMAANNLQQIHLLKMDCEGAEYSILYNLPDEYFALIEKISMETHPGKEKDHNKEAMVQFLQKKGYKVRSGKGSMVWAERR